MIHNIQEMMDKISVIHGLAVQAHREKDRSEKGKPYDVDKVTYLVEQIQALCGDIYNDRQVHPKLLQKEKDKKNK